MAKAPLDCPKGEIGERVQHKASGRIGEIASVSTPPSNRNLTAPPTWCTIKWDGGGRNVPKIVHLFELRLLPIDGS